MEKPPDRHHHVSIIQIGPASVPLDDIGSQPQPRRRAETEQESLRTT
jgi:hypothetical protein